MIHPPSDEAFNGNDFMEDRELERLGEDLRERHNLPTSITIAYRWRRKGGKKGGAPTRGWCVKLSGPAKHFSGKDFLVWIAADAMRDAKFTQVQYRALLFHELLFAGVDINEETGDETPRMNRVDFEGFLAEIENYGCWEDNLREFSQAAEQAPLFGTEAA